jgi:hypothetical protein
MGEAKRTNEAGEAGVKAKLEMRKREMELRQMTAIESKTLRVIRLNHQTKVWRKKKGQLGARGG